eukprot:1344317-Amphidinium_carterae.4
MRPELCDIMRVASAKGSTLLSPMAQPHKQFSEFHLLLCQFLFYLSFGSERETHEQQRSPEHDPPPHDQNNGEGKCVRSGYHAWRWCSAGWNSSSWDAGAWNFGSWDSGFWNSGSGSGSGSAEVPPPQIAQHQVAPHVTSCSDSAVCDAGMPCLAHQAVQQSCPSFASDAFHQFLAVSTKLLMERRVCQYVALQRGHGG